MSAKAKGRFIDPMLLLRTDSLPNASKRWQYQLKFDGYRAIAFKTGGKIHLRSRNDNDFSIRYAGVLKGLTKLPDETVIDGDQNSTNRSDNFSSRLVSLFGGRSCTPRLSPAIRSQVGPFVDMVKARAISPAEDHDESRMLRGII